MTSYSYRDSVDLRLHNKADIDRILNTTVDVESESSTEGDAIPRVTTISSEIYPIVSEQPGAIISSGIAGSSDSVYQFDITSSVLLGITSEDSVDLSFNTESGLTLKLGAVSVILFDASSRLSVGDGCYLASSTFLFRLLDKSDVMGNIVSPTGRIYNIYDRNVSIMKSAC